MKKIFTLLSFMLFLGSASFAQTVITHSSSEAVWTGGSATCSDAGAPYINHFMRRYDLTDFPEVVDTLFYVGFEYGVESTAGGAYDVLMYIWDLSGDFLFGNMTVDVWEPSPVFPDSTNYLRFDTLGTGGYALPTDTIVLDVYTPLSAGPTFYPGSNPYAETDDSYIAADNCAIFEPSTYASISFPNCHIVLQLYGNQKPDAALSDVGVFRDDTLEFTYADISPSFLDPDADDTLRAIRIMGLPTNGTLELGSTPVALYDDIAVEQFDSLVYIPSTGYSGSDSYDIRVKDGWHWSNNTSSVSIDVWDWVLAVEEETAQFDVFPNPSTDFVQIKSDKEISNVRVVDVRGREVISASQETTIDVSSLEDGTYFIEVEINGEKSVQKIIKK